MNYFSLETVLKNPGKTIIF